MTQINNETGEKEKRKRKSNPRRWPKPLAKTLLVIIALPFCLFGFFIVFLLGFPVVGNSIMHITRYPDSEIYFGDSVDYGGASSRIITSYILWTGDEISLVQQHYQQFFPEFEQRERNGSTYLYTENSYTVEGLSLLSTWVRLIDADQKLDDYFFSSGYNVNPNELINNLPDYGTIIIFEHNIFN